MSKPLLVFDLDGTLADTAPDLFTALNHAFVTEGLRKLRSDWVMTEFGRGGRAMVLRGLEAIGLDADEARVERMIDVFLTYYIDHIADFTRPFPGLVEVLERWSARGARFAICTNKRTDYAVKLITELGLIQHFDAVIGGDAVPAKKPDPRHLLDTIARAGGDPSAAVMVGDSDADINAAKAAGVPVIGVRFGYSPDPVEIFSPDAVIAHYDAIDEALAAISPVFAAAMKVPILPA